ncbi:CD48 antigen [Dicentrarchus labrax]|uniref:Ig-like domain-containing protein n=1 Tax=Dicentrarchus labrax TaxID=13489 RepID=A0A8C4GTT1_DICLA|nr:CD48 antigen [Dicentrarchus labrax]
MLPSVTSMMIVVGCLCVLLAFVFADSEKTVYKKVGDEVVLNPDTTIVPTSILWKKLPDIAIEWDGESVEAFREFKGRSSLNISNGEMTITRLTREDSGHYIPEINSVVSSATHLIVISPVPTPTIIKSCDGSESRCTLTCDGNTTDAVPVTYKWKSDDKVLTGSSKDQHIAKEDSSDIKEFSCELENPVSQESSQPIPNPFFTTIEADSIVPGNLKISTGLTVLITMLTAVLLLVFIHRWIGGMWFFQKESMPWEADFWRKQEREPREAAQSNGTSARPEKEQMDEETPMT